MNKTLSRIEQFEKRLCKILNVEYKPKSLLKLERFNKKLEKYI